MDILALGPFVLLLASGVVMLIYHSGIPREELILFINGDQWLVFHHTLTLIAVPLVFLHIIFHWQSIIRLFQKDRGIKHKPLNITLLLLFLSATATGITAWLILKDEKSIALLRDIHNKFGMALIVFFALHLAIHLNWLIRIVKKLINKKRGGRK